MVTHQIREAVAVLAQIQEMKGIPMNIRRVKNPVGKEPGQEEKREALAGLQAQ
ncbi:MAG TPA: hypothetical protein GXX19_13625 [Syntrophomonadaceae bacterium]|nr:hypothetical protein [Syntrophomonadaceae bacterium]